MNKSAWVKFAGSMNPIGNLQIPNMAATYIEVYGSQILYVFLDFFQGQWASFCLKWVWIAGHCHEAHVPLHKIVKKQIR